MLKRLANIYGYADESGSIVFNIPEELNNSGNFSYYISYYISEYIGVCELFIKFDSTIANVVGKVCSPRLELSDTNPDQQLLFFYQPIFSPCVFVKEDQVKMFKLEKHLKQLDLFKIAITQSTISRVKIIQCYLQVYYE